VRGAIPAKALILTANARSDLKAIHEHIADVADRETARAFITKLAVHLERIAATGHAGVPRDRIRPGLRLSVHGRYNIYFRIVGEETVISRILHSARLLTPTAFDEENPQG